MDIANVKLIPIHPCAYRHKGYEYDGIITGMYNVRPTNEEDYRLCYEVTYPDGFKDFVPVANVENGIHKLRKMKVI